MARDVKVHRWRVLLVDDSAVFRRVLMRVLAEDAEIEVVGEAADLASGLAMSGDLRPDVVVIDAELSQRRVCQAIQQMKAERPEVHVIALMTYFEQGLADQARKAGAAVVIAKDEPASHFLAAIRPHPPAGGWG